MVKRTKRPRTQNSIPRTSSHIHHFFLLTPSTVSSRKLPLRFQKTFSLAFHSVPLCFFLVFIIAIAFLALSQIQVLSLSDRFVTSCSSSPCSFFSYSPPFLPFSNKSKVQADVLESSNGGMLPLPPHVLPANMTDEEREFWRQPDGLGYRPCIEFGLDYRKASARIAKEKRKFLVVGVSGGLNQQRNQITDAVVIARILEAALVVPILKFNTIWKDESEFSDIFDVEHFKTCLQSDVRIVSSLPSTHLTIPPSSVDVRIPTNASPLWIRTRFLKRLNHKGVLFLKGGLDSKLSKDLPLDLQKLRCKVAFHALRFAAPIRAVGEKIARRMWNGGPYVALHLRLEKDVWVRSACPSGLGPEYDDIISREVATRLQDLNETWNSDYHQSEPANPCPLTAFQVARLLKGLGTPKSARVYLAGGEPFGGERALQPLKAEFPNLIKKCDLALDGELERFANWSSALAAIDYIVSLSSDVFMPSHGGNMGRLLKGHRAYAGHRKYIIPNKRIILPMLMESMLSNEEFSNTVKQIHASLLGQPEMRTKKSLRDVIAYPVPECMCKRHTSPSSETRLGNFPLGG